MNRLMSTEPPELPWQAESDSDTTLHVLYRFFDASGNLLYVGITCNPSGRFSDHRTKNWWRDVANITLEHADSRKRAGTVGDCRNPIREPPLQHHPSLSENGDRERARCGGGGITTGPPCANDQTRPPRIRATPRMSRTSHDRHGTVTTCYSSNHCTTSTEH